ncbi:exodeoxyribonuclease I subunit D [Labedella gwakjiensis]|uniref:Nuclease SbcCD subunit D n=1 Tax=Labedella gwakjiensis TaxID=390269 RepID=A0A2P8GSD5_9MICO|nr:exonuclease SbcCD subunit D [Labedella gwakjiensis]PSL36876.1 exodeoxyribonuclease I subunit D [Labedella gwakjiensis]RUQ84373.1 exonuclease SbcCD subunit D [Labedella gwakjiensis]
MRILHTSDWHIGRTFHGHSTVGALETVLSAVVGLVRERSIDLVIVAGDVFDSTMPAAEHYGVLGRTLSSLRDAGAAVVVTSGNHDSAARLGYQAEFAQLAGIHVLTRPERHDVPVELQDEHGPVNLYGIPYLEPSLVRHLYPEATLRRHSDVLAFAMDRIRADAAERGGRSVVVSHCFATGAAGSDVERDITAGGLDYVPLATFDGPDYVALGHIHGRATLSERVRYSGAPLHYSFSEADKPRGAWLVDLGAEGLETVEWVALPVPRPLARLTGTLDELITSPEYAEYADHWIAATITDDTRPLDAMPKLQRRFPWCAQLEHRPHTVHDDGHASYASRIEEKSDVEIVAGFLEHVRNGRGPSEAEAGLVDDAFSALRAAEATR